MSFPRTTAAFIAAWLLVGVVRAFSADNGIEPLEIRFGSAAGPFGWATVTVDFNGDGAADFALLPAGAEPAAAPLPVDPDDDSAEIGPDRPAKTLPSAAPGVAAPAGPAIRVDTRSITFSFDTVALHALLRAPPRCSIPTA